MNHARDRGASLIATLLAGSGLASSAGLNAYLPLLILALADRFTTIVELDQPYNLLSSNWGIIILLLILPIELIPDKIPRVDQYNDLLHSAIRPATGAFAFMAYASQNDHLFTVAAMFFGLVIAGGVHWIKLTARPKIAEGTGGIGNPFVSILEDGIAIALAIVATFVPYGILIVLPLGLWLLIRIYRRMSSGLSRLTALSGQQPPAASA